MQATKLHKTFLVIVLAMLTMLGAALGEAADNVIRLNVAHVLADSHPCHQALLQLSEAVKQETNGHVQISVISGGALGSELDEIEQVRMGALDMALLYGISNFQGMEPVCAVEELPFLWENREQAYAAFDGELGKKLAERVEKHGVKILAYWENGFRNFTNNVRPIVKPEDMKGIKFRVAESAIRLDTFRQLGASAVPMPFPELFTALQQGTVDGQENPLSIIYTSRFYEVQKYLSLSGHIWNTAVLIINPARWQRLSERERRVLQDNALKYRTVARQLIKAQDEEFVSQLKKKGMIVNEVDKKAFREAVKPVWDKYEAKFGKDIMDVIRKYASQ
ncbi:MAG: DctP family TRAP transporter solute-binding subunit [Bacillota bacterium]|nr:DctP family TRAP transporter solute-binding subunit [Bacillota bacterium]